MASSLVFPYINKNSLGNSSLSPTVAAQNLNTFKLPNSSILKPNHSLFHNNNIPDHITRISCVIGSYSPISDKKKQIKFSKFAKNSVSPIKHKFNYNFLKPIDRSSLNYPKTKIRKLPEILTEYQEYSNNLMSLNDTLESNRKIVISKISNIKPTQFSDSEKSDSEENIYLNNKLAS